MFSHCLRDRHNSVETKVSFGTIILSHLACVAVKQWLVYATHYLTSFNVRSTVTTTGIMFTINYAATCFDRILQLSSGRCYKNVKGKVSLLIDISVLQILVSHR
jgi:hypothetical protein